MTSAANRPRLPWVKCIYAETGAVCPNGPDEHGNWPCERGPHDECLTCSWTPAASVASTKYEDVTAHPLQRRDPVAAKRLDASQWNLVAQEHERNALALGREGMLTVWDDHGQYVGCMGIELWKALLTVERSA